MKPLPFSPTGTHLRLTSEHAWGRAPFTAAFAAHLLGQAGVLRELFSLTRAHDLYLSAVLPNAGARPGSRRVRWA